MIYPFIGGAANWRSTAYDPQRNLLVVNMTNIGSALKLVRKQGAQPTASEVLDGMEKAPMEGAPYTLDFNHLMSPLELPCTPPPWGVIAAPFGPALKLGTPTFGGPITTKSGLLFIGAAMDDYLRAYDTRIGRELWKGRLPAGGQATPMTYTFEGRQYVVIAAGGHSFSGTRLGDYLIGYSLPKFPSS